jgi:alcohol dehydrogenase class IV
MSVSSDAFQEWKHIVGGAAVSLLNETGQRIYTSAARLGSLCKELHFGNVLAVIDRQALEASGLGEMIEDELQPFAAFTFEDFSSNPEEAEAQAAGLLAAAHGVDSVVAIGGGSCIDVAKLAALTANHIGQVETLIRGEGLADASPLPILAIPTTSGTGSEATHFAAIYVQGRKVSVAHPKLRPCAVALDPRLVGCMPPRLAAVTGLDALAQAVESLWAVGSTPESQRFALAAGQILATHLEPSVLEGDRASRLAVMIGAHLAGQAINLSKTTAAHALSYMFTKCHGLAHGHAVALTLGFVAAANAEVQTENCIDPRGPDFVRRRVTTAAALLDTTPAELPARMQALLTRLKLPATLTEAGVPVEDVDNLAALVDPVRLGNNPRRFTPTELSALLRNACLMIG